MFSIQVNQIQRNHICAQYVLKIAHFALLVCVTTACCYHTDTHTHTFSFPEYWRVKIKHFYWPLKITDTWLKTFIAFIRGLRTEKNIKHCFTHWFSLLNAELTSTWPFSSKVFGQKKFHQQLTLFYGSRWEILNGPLIEGMFVLVISCWYVWKTLIHMGFWCNYCG